MHISKFFNILSFVKKVDVSSMKQQLKQRIPVLQVTMMELLLQKRQRMIKKISDREDNEHISHHNNYMNWNKRLAVIGILICQHGKRLQCGLI